MSDTSIEWTDKVWNPTRGCSRVSEGCRHCYAERVATRFSGVGGPGARPLDVAWARSIVAQCKAAGTPVFVKQLGARPVQRVVYGAMSWTGDEVVNRDPMPIRDRKGGNPDEWPADLRVRQFPEVQAR